MRRGTAGQETSKGKPERLGRPIIGKARVPPRISDGWFSLFANRPKSKAPPLIRAA